VSGFRLQEELKENTIPPCMPPDALGKALLHLFRTAVQSRQLDVAEHLLAALETLAARYPEAQEELNAAYLVAAHGAP
jgi:hypothetical protein